MASRYWVGGTGVWDASSTTHWSATSGGSSGASAPTSADDVFFDQAGTYNVQLTSTAVACNNYTVSAGTVTFSGAFVFSIYGNFSVTASTVFSSTNTTFAATTAKTITTNNATLSSFTFDGVGGTWSLQDNLISNGTITLTNGTLNLNNKTFTCSKFLSSNSNIRTIAFGTTGYIVITGAGTAWDFTTYTNFTTTGTQLVYVTNNSASLVVLYIGYLSEANAISFIFNGTGTGNTYFGGNQVRNITFTNSYGGGIAAGGSIYAFGSFYYGKSTGIDPSIGVTFFGSSTPSTTNTFYCAATFGTLISIQLNDVTNKIILQSPITSTSYLQVYSGILDLNGYAVTLGSMTFGFLSNTVIFNGSKLTLTDINTFIFVPDATHTTLSAGSVDGAIVSMTGASAKTFGSSGLTFNYPFTLDQGGAGALTIDGASITFVNITNSYVSTGATSILFPALGGVVTVSSFTATGAVGKVLTLASTSAGNNANVVLTGGGFVSGIDYLTYKDIFFTPTFNGNGTVPYSWYGGVNSVNLGNSTGIVALGSNFRAYQLNSSTSWTVPGNWSNTNNTVYLFGAGGGGAGGRATSTSNRAAGAGGGGGGFTKVTNITLGSTVAYALGAGGTSGSSGGGSGGAGGTTTFDVYSAAGGGGGSTTTGPTSVGGAGGVGATYTGGVGGAGGITTTLNYGVGGGGAGGAAGPLGNGGAGGAGAEGATNVAGGGGGGNGGGFAGGNAVANTSGGVGGNNAFSAGGGAANSGNGTLGGGSGGGLNISGGIVTASSLDVYQTRGAGSNGGPGGGGGSGSTGARGAGGSGGAVSTGGGSSPGGVGGAGFIFIIYAIGPINSSFADTVTGTDLISPSYISNTVISETATSTDNANTIVTFSPIINETATSTDLVAPTYIANTTIDETATSTDLIASRYIANTVIDETATSTDLVLVGTYITSQLNETITSTDLVAPSYIANTTVNETATSTDLVLGGIYFVSQLNETITGTDLVAPSYIANTTINETATSIDTVSTTNIFNVNFTDYVTVYSGVVATYLWSPIVDDQTPNWQNVGTTQVPTWTSVNNAQTPIWVKIVT